MDNRVYTSFGKRAILAFGFLGVLVFGAYSNTFDSSWHLDDFPTLVDNPALHLEDLSAGSLGATFYSRPGPLGTAYRPVSCLSLALNWYIGGQQVTGYHLVNISIHLLTAFFLFLTLFNLLHAPRLAVKNRAQAFYVALLSAAFWALNPVQTQAVTYIVQRMASLAAMFYILGLYCYVKGRVRPVGWQRNLFFTAVFICYALAVGSKENAVLMPLALGLIEVTFFQDLDSVKNRFRVRLATASIGVGLLAIFIYIVYFSSDLSLLRGYQHRGFTLGQRLLTEPRIVIFYLSQLLYPMPQRLSIEHAVELSTSLFDPWTTAAALTIVVILIGLGIYQIKDKPILAFALLFFFVNHLVESTVLPLELVFEHRNYLPSMFLFFPVATALVRLVDYYRQRSKLMSKALGVFIVLLVLGLGVSTYVRNSVWATEKTLWEDAVTKAPGRARATYNLAKQYARGGHLDAALALYQRALMQKASKPRHTQAMILNGIASIHYMKREYETALLFCQKAQAVKPNFEPARYNQVLVLAKLNRWQNVNDQIDLQLARHKSSKLYLFLKGELLLKQNQPLEALGYMRQALKLAPHDKKILLNIGEALNFSGHYRQAEWFFKQARSASPKAMQPYLYLIETSLRLENKSKTERYLDDLITRFTFKKLHLERQGCFEQLGLPPASQKLICSAVNDKITRMSDEMTRMGGS